MAVPSASRGSSIVEIRWIGSDLEEHAAGLAEVDGLEVLPVQHRRDIEAQGQNGLPPSELLGLIARAEGDVMHRARAHPSAHLVGLAQQVDNSGRDFLLR